MSWIGDSLNSLSGHISNISTFTKEVLNEGREEVSDHTTELRIAQQKIQDLERQCALQQQEVERLKDANSELQNRCHASELQMSAASSEYRAVVQQKNEEIRTLRQQSHQEEELLLSESCAVPAPSLPSSTGWSSGVESSPDSSGGGYGFLGDEADLSDLIASQHEINRLTAEVRKLRAERDKWRERANALRQAGDGDPVKSDRPGQDDIFNDYTQLKAKEQQLQIELKKTIDQHQQHLAALQSHHSQKISELQKNHHKEIQQLKERLFLEQDNDQENENDAESTIKSLRFQLIEAKNKDAEKENNFAEMQRLLREKERTVQLLSRQMEKLQGEKTKLEKKLEEMSQHQAQLNENVQRLEIELKQQRHDHQLSLSKLKETAGDTKSDDAEVNALRKRLQESEQVIEELRSKREQSNTAEVLENIQTARKKVSFAADERHAFHLHEKQEIINKMIEASEQKSKLKKLLYELNEESSSTSSEILKLIQSLGNNEQQEMVAGFINTIQLENKVLKTRNDELETILRTVHERFGGNETQDLIPDNAHNQSSDSSLWLGLPSSSPRDLRAIKSNFSSSLQSGGFGDQEDVESLGSSAVSELSIRNRELDEQVQVLQHQVEKYERDIEHFELVEADWQLEKCAMEEVLLKLRAQLRQKEQSLSVVTAKRGLMEVKKKEPLTEVLTEISISDDFSGGTSTEGDIDLERLQEQIEEMTQGNAQLENERDVLQAEKQGLLKELMNLRQVNQQLEEKMERMNNLEMSSTGGVISKRADSQAQQEFEAIQREKSMLETSLVELDHQHQEAMEKVLQMKEQLTMEKKVLQNELRQMEEKCSALDHENLLLKVEVETLREQMANLIPTLVEKERKASKEDAGAALDFLSDEDNADDDMDVKEDALKSIMQAVHTLNTDNLSLEEDIAALQEERKQLELRVSQLEREREELSLQNEELQREVTTLQECSQLMEELHEENKKLDEFLKEKTHKLEEEEAKIVELLRKVEALEMVQKDLTEEKDAAWRKVEDCSIENDNLKSEFVELNSRLSLQEREINALKKELDRSKEDNRALQKLLKMSEERLEKQESLHKSEMDKLKSTLHSTASTVQECSKLKQMLEEREMTIKHLESGKSKLLNLSEDQKVELDLLRSKVAELEFDCKELNHQISKFKDEAISLRLIQENSHKGLLIEKTDAAIQTFCQNGVVLAEDMTVEVAIQTYPDGEINEQTSVLTCAKENFGCQTDLITQVLQSDLQSSDNLNLSPQTLSDNKTEIQHLKQRIEELSVQLQEKDKLVTMKEEEVRKCNDSIKSLESSVNNKTYGKVYISTAIQHPADDNHVFSEKDIDESISGNMLNVTPSSIYKRTSFDQTMDSNDNKLSNLLERIHQLEVEKEQTLLVLNDKAQECKSLKSEVLRLVNIVSAEKQALAKLQQDNQELMQRCEVPDQSMTKEAVQNLSRIIRDKDLELEALKQKVNTLLAVLQQSSSEGTKIEELITEHERLVRELGAYKADREQIIAALNHKHHESLQYHAEMQRLQTILASESLKYDALNQEHRTVSQQFEEKQKSLMNTQNELISLKQRVSELERQHSDLCQKYDQMLHNRNSSNTVSIETQEWNAKLQQIVQLEETVKDKEKWLLEKDHMVHQLSQEIQKLKEDVGQKEASLKMLQRHIDTLNSKVNIANGERKTAQQEATDAQKQLKNAGSEVLVLKEANKRLTMVVQEREFEVKALHDKVSVLTSLLQEKTAAGVDSNPDMDRLIADSEAMQMKAQQFQHERDELVLALSQRQQEQQEMQTQLHRARDKEEKLLKEVDRLRAHLLQVEDTHTHEVLAAEAREKELRNRLAQVEEKVHASSSEIHNISQQSIVQVESLQEQLRLVIRQRDEAQAQASLLEDKVHEHAASIYNLQLVMEQYQKEHERECQELKKLHQTQLNAERSKTQNLLIQLQKQEEQMSQTSEALDAASRLSEQLDRKEEVIAALREEVLTKEMRLQKLEQEIKNMKSSTEGKVDKQVMKNLVLGYFSTPPGQQPEVMRLLAKILDFNQDEMSKAGIRIGKDTKDSSHHLTHSRAGTGSWITNLLRATPNQPVTSLSAGGSSSSSVMLRGEQTASSAKSSKQSFSSLFVQFLEKESQPPPKIRLPAEEMALELTRKNSLPTKNPNMPPRSNPFLNEQIEPDTSLSSSGMNPIQSQTGLPTDHLLMRPISDALPTFTPVPITQSYGSRSSAAFLQEVLK